MKKITKYIFTCITIFVVLFVITAFVHNTTATSNEDEISLKIAACNLSFEDSVKILYAVESTGISDYENIELYSYETLDDYYNHTNYHKLVYLGNRTISHKLYSIFADKDVAAKQMTTDFYTYVRYENDENIYSADLVKYSILQYVKNMYGTDDSTKELDDTLMAMLEYGACTQKLFDYKEDRLANDTYYELKLEDGYLEDNTNHGLFKEDEEVSFGCWKDDFAYWLNKNDNSIYSYEPLITTTISSDLSLKAVIGLESSEGLAYTLNELGDKYEVSGIGTCSDVDIVIPSTYNDMPVTSIKDEAFKDNTTIKSLKTLSSLNHIGESAFSGCTSLEKVLISSSVYSIGEYAFSGCTSLKEVTISNILDFNSNIFDSCTAIKNVYYFDTVKNYEILPSESQIEFMNKHNLYFYSNTFNNDLFMDNYFYWHLANFEPVIWDYENNNLVYYLNTQTNTYKVSSQINDDDTDENIYIPSFYNGLPVTEIGFGCFMNNEVIKNVYIGKNVNTVNDHAFSNCINLENVYMSDGVINLGSCFDGCEALEYVKLSSSLTSLASCLFRQCSSLKSLIIPEGVTSIGDSCFRDTTGLEQLILPSTLSYIGEYAFSNLSTNTVKIFYNGTYDDFMDITILNYNGFYEGYQIYYYLEECNFEEGNYWHYVEGVPTIWDNDFLTYSYADDECEYYLCTGTSFNYDKVLIPSVYNGKQVIGIKRLAFESKDNLKKVVIKDGITTIGTYCFYNCSSLEEVVLPHTLTSIGVGAFANCDSLTYLVLPKSLTNIGTHAFDPTSLVVLYYMGSESEFEAIDIDEEDTNLLDKQIYYYSLYYPTSNPTSYWHYVDGVPTVWDNTNNFTYTLNASTTEYEITSYNGSNCSEVVIPATYNGNPVTSIGNGVFMNNTNIKYISIPDTIAYIGDNAFYNCSSITDIVIPKDISTIGESAFEGMTNLNNIYYLGDSVRFNKIEFGENNTLLMDKVRYYQSSYKDTCVDSIYWYYDDGIPTMWKSTKGLLFTLDEQINTYTLSGFGSSLFEKTIIIPSTYNGKVIDKIADYVLSINCYVEKIYMPDTICEMGDFNIYDLYNLNTLILSSNLSVIGDRCINNCDNLEYVLLPAGIDNISLSSFADNDILDKIYYLGNKDSFEEISGKEILTSKFGIYFYSENLPIGEGSSNLFYLEDGIPKLY